MAKLIPGDRIAYAAKFLKNTGQFTGEAPMRRGTYLSGDDKFSYVRWDDAEERIARAEGDYAEADYREHVRKHGNMVATGNIAKVGSARFALNDL